ncbi:type III secretion system protein PrgM, partial [Enterococcus faecalis]
KKKDRVEKELNKANERLDTLKQSIAKKENELKQIEAEIVSALLTENNLSFSELTALLSEKESGGEASVYRE